MVAAGRAPVSAVRAVVEVLGSGEGRGPEGGRKEEGLDGHISLLCREVAVGDGGTAGCREIVLTRLE